MPQVVKHHIAVENRVAVTQAFFSETIVVVPRLHILNHILYVAVCGKHPHALVVQEHIPHIRGGEPEHLVQFRLGGSIPTDVEAAGEVVECDGAYSGEEDALEIALELLEKVPVEPVGVGDGVIDFLALFVQNHVGEVVVFVNYQV